MKRLKSKPSMRNLHVPLPEELYRRLRTEAERARRPATVLAREAIGAWLAGVRRRLIHEAIEAYARDAAGTRDDLDRSMEAAALEHLKGARQARRSPA
jgi:predicted transcriptional regulator